MELKELQKKYEELGAEIEKLKKEEESTYPIYKKHTTSNLVVKFIGLEDGIVKNGNSTWRIADTSNVWTRHTDKDTWEDIAFDEERGLFDKQLVWCWEDDETYGRTLRFYNAKDKRSFTPDGKRSGFCFDNYEPYEGEYPKWAKEAYRTLED